MDLTKRLREQIKDLKAVAPVTTQTLYCGFVNVLKHTVKEVAATLAAGEESTEPASSEGEAKEGEAKDAETTEPPSPPPGNSTLQALLEEANALVDVSHAEYWLGVATEKVAKIECATEGSVKVRSRAGSVLFVLFWRSGKGRGGER